MPFFIWRLWVIQNSICRACVRPVLLQACFAICSSKVLLVGLFRHFLICYLTVSFPHNRALAFHIYNIILAWKDCKRSLSGRSRVNATLIKCVLAEAVLRKRSFTLLPKLLVCHFYFDIWCSHQCLILAALFFVWRLVKVYHLKLCLLPYLLLLVLSHQLVQCGYKEALVLDYPHYKRLLV